MNGEEVKFLKEISGQQHEENLSKFKTLFEKTDSIIATLGKLSCEAHAIQIKKLEKDVESGFKRVDRYLIAVILLGIVLGMWVK